jgi:predicted ATPase
VSVQIEVREFGPIGHGVVSLRPLTVFIGPNNAGKSVFSMLTYAVHRSVPSLSRNRLYGYRAYLAYGGYLRAMPPEDVGEAIDKFLQAQMRKESFSLDGAPQELHDWLHASVNNALVAFGTSVATELERCFGSPLTDLVRKSGKVRKEFSLRVTHQSPSWTIDLKVKWGKPSVSVETAIDTGAFLSTLTRTPDRNLRRYFTAGVPKSALLEQLLVSLLDLCFAEFASPAYYLPAARSGILQSHKALASSLVSRAPLAGIEDMAIPKMSGVISDFISVLLNLEPESRQHFDGVARFLETGVLQGKIAIEGHPPVYPEMWYKSGSARYPLHRTSSMVSELAPVVLFLRYVVNVGETLIIEEPESHLHPASQLRLARAIARLVNQNVRVILTTHSDYFLNQLNNLITASSLSSARRVAAGYDPKEAITPVKVGAYLFDSSARAGGTVVRELEVDRREGVSDAEFARVAELLYNETVDLTLKTASAKQR